MSISICLYQPTEYNARINTAKHIPDNMNSSGKEVRTVKLIAWVVLLLSVIITIQFILTYREPLNYLLAADNAVGPLLLVLSTLFYSVLFALSAVGLMKFNRFAAKAFNVMCAIAIAIGLFALLQYIWVFSDPFGFGFPGGLGAAVSTPQILTDLIRIIAEVAFFVFALWYLHKPAVRALFR